MGRNDKDFRTLDRIEMEIPHVRCTAHSLCGDWHAADRLAAECIAAAVADCELLAPKLSARAWLMRLLWRIHGAGQKDRIAPAGVPDRAPKSVLGDRYEFADIFSCFRSLDDEARFILVLISVNKLSHEEAAYVFDTSVDEFRRLLAGARSRLNAQVAHNDLPAKNLTI